MAALMPPNNYEHIRAAARDHRPFVPDAKQKRGVIKYGTNF
jgi:hypothetical protein